MVIEKPRKPIKMPRLSAKPNSEQIRNARINRFKIDLIKRFSNIDINRNPRSNDELKLALKKLALDHRLSDFQLFEYLLKANQMIDQSKAINLEIKLNVKHLLRIAIAEQKRKLGL